MPRTKGAKQKKPHKEKPHKEKKQRGRPKGSIKQKQKQNQTVNVKVVNNNGGGGGGGDKKITIPVPFQLPSTIYDPSLVQPHYGINERQPVNPLTDAATDLMTPMIQSMISNQIISRNPAAPGQGKPIKEKDVTPVNPVITKPPEETIKNPQTDQSHPIKPDDIIMDSNISSSIHDKHQQHKKIKDMIKPEAPKVIKQPKYKDTEGLGANIPIQNIGALATSIATGALTGGATAAGEALITGGLSGLMGAGESIAGSAIGGGVATGVNNALGGGDVGHMVSAIAGSLAGRTAVNKIKANRARTNSEAEPLLGNRLGGRNNGRSNLVPQEETTQPTILNRVRRAAQRTMDEVNDTVSRIRHQITGRARRGGTYARLTNDESEQPATSNTEPRTINLTDEIMPVLNAKAAKIQKFIRKRRQKANQAKIDQEFQENHQNLLDERQQRINELDEILRKDNEQRILQNKSATKIQNALKKLKNRKSEKSKVENFTKKILDDSMKEIKIEDQAATKIQRATRKRIARKDYEFDNLIYPQIKAKRQEQVKTTQPSLNLQTADNLPPRTQFTSSLLEQELQASRTRAQKLYQEAKQRQPPLPVSSNLQTGTQQKYKNLIKSGDIQRAATERTKRINEKTMKARQITDDTLVKQQETLKKDAIKKDAAIKLQKAVKRKIAEGNISKIKQAKDKIAGNVKALFTEKASFFKAPKVLGNRTIITNKKTVGQPLALNRQLEFVSKKKQAAAREGYVNRQAFLEMAEKYKDIMKKGKK